VAAVKRRFEGSRTYGTNFAKTGDPNGAGLHEAQGIGKKEFKRKRYLD
jgi:hypothetical protein